MSLRSQLNFLFFTIILAISIGSLWLQQHQKNQIFTINLEEQASAINALIAKDFAKLIYLDSLGSASEIYSQLKQIDSLQSARVFNIEGKLLFRFATEKKIKKEEKSKVSSGLSFQGTKLGHVDFEFYSQRLSEKNDELNFYFIFVSIALYLLTIFLVIYIDKKYIRHLSGLNTALKKTTSSKDFSIRLKPQSKDEIGQALENFNQLVSMVETKTNRLKYQANHDSLTGLYSRSVLIDEINESIKSPPYQLNGLCYIDLDQFKVINDTCGHKAGDLLLTQLANEFKSFLDLHPSTTIGRIGGDEFILLIKNRSLEEINTLTIKLLEMIRNLNFSYFNKTFPIGASFGLITYHQTELCADDILSAADAACYEGKEKGRNKIIHHSLSETVLSNNQKEMSLVSQIFEALEGGNFELFLQPIIDTKSMDYEQPKHFETLLRMTDNQSQNSYISPALFIPVAEHYALSERIDFWVVENLFLKLSTEKIFTESIQTISINLSIASLVSEEMAHKIAALFLKHKIDYQTICFEITETGVSSQVNNAVKFINFFKNLGVSFSLDDFGTGMSSFNYLSKLDVDYLKIDGAFIAGMDIDPVKQKMVLAMANIGQTLNKKIIAEFVETEQIVSLLRQMDIDYLQGYFFSEAKPIQYFINKSCNDSNSG